MSLPHVGSIVLHERPTWLGLSGPKLGGPVVGTVTYSNEWMLEEHQYHTNTLAEPLRKSLKLEV